MKKNVGSIDKTVRIILGVIIFGAGIYFQSWWGLIGIIPLMTGMMGSCPIFQVMGISSNKDGEVTAKE